MSQPKTYKQFSYIILTICVHLYKYGKICYYCRNTYIMLNKLFYRSNLHVL